MREPLAAVPEILHHFSKVVAGSPLRRPPPFFVVRQQGEGIVDVTTHLVDLVHWQCFPGQVVDYETEVEVLSGRRWPTRLTPAPFEHVTGLGSYPEYLAGDVGPDSMLDVYANGEIRYRVKGLHARVSVEWRYEAPEGTGYTHFSVMRGSKATLTVRQGEEEGYTPTLYVVPADGVEPSAMEAALQEALAELVEEYPGVTSKPASEGWPIVIPDEYKVGHGVHFGQVTEAYFGHLAAGALPPEGVPNILTKYFITTRALELTRQ